MPEPTHHNPSLLRQRGWSVLICLLICGSGWAQELVLHLLNGDRLSGRLLTESTNEVVLTTAFSERVSVPANLIVRRESVAAATNQQEAASGQVPPPDAPATGIASELEPASPPNEAPATAGSAEAPAKAPAKPAEVPAPPAEAPAKPVEAPAKLAEPPAQPPEPSAFRKFLQDWRGEAQLGASLGFGNKDRQTFTGRIKLTHNHSFPQQRVLRNILDYDVAYGITDSVLSDNRMDGNWKVEYDFSKRFLAYNASRAGYDEIRRIDFQYDFGPGLGYKWLVLTNFVFKTELGGNYQEQFFVGDRKTSRYSLRIAEDSWWQITPKIRWDQKIEFFPEVQHFTNYRFRVESNLSYLLKQNLTLTLNVVDLYDSGVPSGVSNNDLQIRSLLGIKF